jgi:hypothetical protein
VPPMRSSKRPHRATASGGEPRQTSETVTKRNGPSDFRPRWAVFHQFEITKNSEPSNIAASSSAAHTTEIESHSLSLLWIMNPPPADSGITPGSRICP